METPAAHDVPIPMPLTAPGYRKIKNDPGTHLIVTDLDFGRKKSADRGRESQLSEKEILIACVEPNSMALFVERAENFQIERRVTENVSIDSERDINNETLSNRNNIESALRATKPVIRQRDDTLRLIDQPGAEVKQYNVRKPSKPKVHVADTDSVRSKRSKQSSSRKVQDSGQRMRTLPVLKGRDRPDTMSQSPDIMVGGSNIQMSQQRLQTMGNPIVNSDLKNVMSASKEGSLVKTENKDD